MDFLNGGGVKERPGGKGGKPSGIMIKAVKWGRPRIKDKGRFYLGEPRGYNLWDLGPLAPGLGE